MRLHIENIFFKKRRESNIREFLKLPDNFKLKSFKHGFYLINSFTTVENIQKNNEIIEDILSKTIYLIKRIPKKYKNDHIAIYTKDFKKRTYQNEVPKEKLSSIIGYPYQGDLKNIPLCHSFLNKTILYIAGGIGSGKSNQGNILFRSFMFGNTDFQAIICDPKGSDFISSYNLFKNRSILIQMKTIEDFKNLLEKLHQIEREILEYQKVLDKKGIVIVNWKDLSDRPKFILFIDEASEVIPKVSISKTTPKQEHEFIQTQLDISYTLKRMIKTYRYTSSFFCVLLNQSSKVDSININWENLKSKILYNQPTPQQSVQLIGNTLLRDNSLFKGRAYYISEGIIEKFQAPFINIEVSLKIPKKSQVNELKKFINRKTQKELNNHFKIYSTKESKEKYQFLQKSEYQIRQMGSNYYQYYLSLLPEIRIRLIKDFRKKNNEK